MASPVIVHAPCRGKFLAFLLASFLVGSACPLYAGDPIRLALVFAQIGMAAKEEAPAHDAARVAVAEINASGGLLGKPLELIAFDTRSTPLGAKKAAQDAANAHVAAIIGAYRSSHSLAMVPVVHKARIPMISPASTNPEVTKGSPYAFRVCFVDSFQGSVMASFASHELKARRAAVLTNVSEDYSIELAKVFKERFGGSGGTIVWEGTYTGNAVDFRGILVPLKELRADVIYVPGYARDSGLIISQARAMGILSTFLGADGWDQQIADYAGPAAEGAFCTTHWHKDNPSEANTRLKNAYRKAMGGAIIDNIRIPLTYDAVMLFADAVRRAGSSSPDFVRNALATTRGFKGATGTITMGPDRNPVGKEASIMRFQNGSWTYYTTFSPSPH